MVAACWAARASATLPMRRRAFARPVASARSRAMLLARSCSLASGMVSRSMPIGLSPACSDHLGDQRGGGVRISGIHDRHSKLS